MHTDKYLRYILRPQLLHPHPCMRTFKIFIVAQFSRFRKECLSLPLPVVFQKVCLCRRLQILQICKYSDSWFQNNTPRRVVLLFVL